MRRIALFVCMLSCLMTGAALCIPIGQAKTMPPGSSATVTGSITLIGPTECYLESTNGTSGIWVQADTTGFSLNDVVNAAGVMGTSDGEIVLQSAGIALAGDPKIMSSVGMANKWLNGSLEKGLLVTTWGKVTAVCYSPETGAHWFHIDDGSRVRCDYGDTGVIVYSDADVSEGDYVRVTGISSVETALDDATKLVRVVRTRSSDDVSCLKKFIEKPICPFSDEFDSPSLDYRWGLVGKTDYVSLTSDPGWLALSPDTELTYYGSPHLIQAVCGDWDMEIKTKLPADYTRVLIAGISIWLSGTHLINNEPLAASHCIAQIVKHQSDLNVAAYARIYCSLSETVTLQGDTYWAKVRMRRPNVYISVSDDGVNYSPECSCAADSDFLVIDCFSRPYDKSAKALIDYIRFTRVDG